MHRPRGLIFDLDGTLIDSLDDIAAALNRALREVGRAPAPRDSVRRWIGDGLPTLCRRAWPDASNEDTTRFVERVSIAYRADCATHTRPYPNMLQMLELLQSRGVPMAVLTNKPHDLTLAILAAVDLAKFFNPVRGYQRESEKKPSPAVALSVASEWKIEPREIAVVGDSDVDIRTARNAGMRAIAVTWGLRDRAELVDAGPDDMVDEPLAIIEKIFS